MIIPEFGPAIGGRIRIHFAETAVGVDPVAAVEMMNRFIKRVEPRLPLVNHSEIASTKRMIVEIIGNLVYNEASLVPDQVDGIITAK